MEIKNEKQMVVTDNEGKEHLMQILFTYDNEERDTSYVFFYDTEDKDEEVVVMRYLESGELEPIEDDEEYYSTFCSVDTAELRKLIDDWCDKGIMNEKRNYSQFNK